MITLVFILSLISIAISLIPTFGIVFATLILIFSVILLRKYGQTIYKKKTIIASIIICVVSVINSFIFTFYINIFQDFLLSNITESVDNTKNLRLMQDYSSLQTAITFTKGSSSSIKNIITSENTNIIKESKDITSYPEDIQKITALSDKNVKYYNINYNSLKTTVLLTKSDCWVIDKNGKVFLNIDNYKKY